MLLQATPGDFSLYEKTAKELDGEAAKAGLAETLQNAVDFYRTAKERDEIFFRKITGDPRFKDNIAVVAGGFLVAPFVRKQWLP